MGYIPRLTAPSYEDSNWRHISVGGKNSCIQIADGSVLPNCVGYAWGRFMEILGSTPKLSRGNAENWYGANDGYERGQTPKLGAVICWRKGQAGNESDGAGHVAIVEKINADGSIVTSNSGYGSSRFWIQTMKAPYNVGSNYFFQGFIYNPAVIDEPTPQPTKSIDELANEVIQGLWGNGQDRVNNLTNAGYDYNAVQKRVDEILTPAPAPQPEPAVDILDLVKRTIRGDFGNGNDRRAALGSNFREVQRQVNINLAQRTTNWDNIRLY